MSNSTRANDKTVTSLLKKQGENVRSLILNNWTKLTKKGMMVISTMCPNLETLSISGCEYSTRNDKGISADSIISVIEKCNLKIIDFSWFKVCFNSCIILPYLVYSYVILLLHTTFSFIQNSKRKIMKLWLYFL